MGRVRISSGAGPFTPFSSPTTQLKYNETTNRAKDHQKELADSPNIAHSIAHNQFDRDHEKNRWKNIE
jgi:hypothetical protein